MALPENALSSEFIPAAFAGGRSLPISPLRDFETGGIALDDPSEGHLYQIWQARIFDKERIEISAEEVDAFNLWTGNNLTEVSLTFDQNMRATFAFVENGEAKLRWFDSSQGGMVTTNFGSAYKTPRVALDDKRTAQMGTNDIIFAYLRAGNLYYRQQRDRFGVERLLRPNVASNGIIKIGMNRVNRFQFLMSWPS